MRTNAQPHYILVDLDDTVYPTQTEGPLPQGFHEALGRFSELIQQANEGTLPPIGFCTGREIEYIIVATRTLVTPSCWSVVENGLCLYNLATEDRINHPLLTQEVEQVFCQIRERIPLLIQRFPDLRPYLRKEVNLALERQRPRINLAGYVAPVEEMLSEFTDFLDITHSGNAIDLMPKGINKGSGAQELCKAVGIEPTQILSIGDSANDFPIMELAGYVGCPSNAQERCHELMASKEGYASLYPYVVGVVDIIHHYIPEVT